MDHYFNTIVIESCAAPQPIAEMEVHGPISVAMGHPLNQQPARGRKLTQLLAGTAKITRSESSQLPMDNYSPCRRGIARANRAPHMHPIAGCRQGRSEKMGVITHSTHLRRIFAGNNVPFSYELCNDCTRSCAAIWPVLRLGARPCHSPPQNRRAGDSYGTSLKNAKQFCEMLLQCELLRPLQRASG